MAFGSDVKLDILANDKTGRAIASARKNLTGLGTTARNVLGGLGVGLSATALIGFSKSVIEYGSSLTDAAAATNTSVEALQALRYAAQEAGADAAKMDMALVRVQKAAIDARNGLSTYTRAFDALGINVDQFIALPAERKLESVARAMRSADDKQAAYAAAMDILGTRNAPKLMEVLQRLGTEGFDEVAKSAKAAGQVMSEYTAEQLDAAADSIERFKTRMTVAGGEVLSFWMNAADGLNPWEEKINSAADAMMNNFSPAQQELTRLQDAYFKAQDAGAGGKYLAYLDDLIQAKMEEVRVTREQAEAQEELNRSVGDMDKLVAAERKYNEARRTEEQQLRSLEVEYEQLQKQIEEYYRSGMEGSQDVLDIQTRQVEVETRLLRLKEQQNRELETSRERYEDLLREQKILLNPDSEASLLSGEIKSLESELNNLSKGTAEWFEKQAEIIGKTNELIRIRKQDEQDAAKSQDERLRKEQEFIDSVLYGKTATDKAVDAPRSSSHLMADYSNPDYASPWAGFVPPAAAVPAMVPVGQLATTSPSAPESAPMQNAAEAVRGSMTKAADVFDRVVQVVKEFTSRLEIAEQQIANAR